jgi:hypothetical protein
MQWSVEGHYASLQWAAWRWQFNRAQPTAGVTLVGPSTAPWQVLEIHPLPKHACQIDDGFARGSDLMVRYAQSAEDRFAFQIDFRAVPTPELASADCGFDIWLSVQTQLLDAHPSLEVTSGMPGGQWLALGDDGQAIDEGPVAMLTCQMPTGYVALLIHPSDQSQAELVSGDGQGRLRLFGNFMEKGVIRRGRLRCLVGSHHLAAIVLRQVYESFAHSPLPLTT